MPAVSSFSERLSEQLAELQRWALAAHLDEVKSLQEENDNLRVQIQKIGAGLQLVENKSRLAIGEISNGGMGVGPSDAGVATGGSWNPRFQLRRRPNSTKEQPSPGAGVIDNDKGEAPDLRGMSVSSTVSPAPDRPRQVDISTESITWIDHQPLDKVDSDEKNGAGGRGLLLGKPDENLSSPLVASHAMSAVSDNFVNDPFVDVNRLLEDALLEAVTLGNAVATQLADEALQVAPNYAEQAILRLLRKIQGKNSGIDSSTGANERHRPAALFLKRQPRESDESFDKNVAIHDAQPGLRWLFGVLAGLVMSDSRCFLPVLTAFMNGMPRDTDLEVMSASCVAECIKGVVSLLRTGIQLCQEKRTSWEDLVFGVFCAVCLADHCGPLGRDLHWIHHDSFAAELFLAAPAKVRTNLVAAVCAPEKLYGKYMADERYNVHLVDDAFRRALPQIDGGLSGVPVFAAMCFRPEYSGQPAPTVCMIVLTPPLLLEMTAESQLLICKTVAEVSSETGAAHARFPNWITIPVLEALAAEPARWCFTTLRRRNAHLESWLALDGERKFASLVRAFEADDPSRHLASLMQLCERLVPVCERLSVSLARVVQKKLVEVRANQAMLQTGTASGNANSPNMLWYGTQQALERSENHGRALLDSRRGIWR